jgi:putative ABC transport system permease protein
MMVLSNRLRLKLSIMGVIVATVILLAGMVSINAFVSKQYEKYQRFDKDVAVLTGSINGNFIDSLKSTFPEAVMALYSDQGSLEPYSGGDSSPYSILPMVHGVSSSFLSLPLPFDTDCAYTATIVSGRDISQSDIVNKRKVVVISEFTSRIFFGEDNPVGKTIPVKLLSSDSVEEYKVIGVYGNTPAEREAIINMMTNNDPGFNVKVDFYVPYTLFSSSQEKNISTVVFYSPQNRFSVVEKAIDILIKPYNGNIVLYTYNNRIQLVENAQQSMNIALAFIAIFIIVVSGLNMLNCLFFSIKERIGEIGIRKAIGATKISIMVQFIFESMLITMVGVIIGIGIVTFLFIVLSAFSIEIFRAQIVFAISKEMILSTIIVLLLQGVLFSIIPARYAANIKIVNALRFD